MNNRDEIQRLIDATNRLPLDVVQEQIVPIIREGTRVFWALAFLFGASFLVMALTWNVSLFAAVAAFLTTIGLAIYGVTFNELQFRRFRKTVLRLLDEYKIGSTS